MLSICLPVYEEDVCKLVADLHRQCVQLQIQFEILVADDHSSQSFLKINRSINQLEHCQLIELHENIGRSAIRNLLAEKANFQYLLFLDADTELISDSFIKNYIEKSSRASVICGGIRYLRQLAPEGYRLRQKYGWQRESTAAAERSHDPYRSFMTTNYWIERTVAIQYPFYPSIREYGHEDTLLGLDLEAEKVRILHIDNPVLHLPKDNDVQFLNKTTQAVSNLVLLLPLLSQYKQVHQRIKLLRYHYLISKFKLDFIVLIFFYILNKQKEKYFKIASIQLILLDFYKIGLLISLIRKNK